ncbi:MAG: hypothetical protein II284_01900 [Clostridia bacterium]|nr:hypothetical protein [Clostridia bacterium]
MPSKFSEKAVIIPKKAETHIQKTAPVPPTAIAPATPVMLPVPMVAARVVQTAPNWEMEPFSRCFFRLFLKRLPTVEFSQ